MERVGLQRMMAGEGLAEGVDGRGADVAEYDADRAHHQLGERALGSMTMPMTVLGHRRVGGLGSAFSGDVHRARPLAGRSAPCN